MPPVQGPFWEGTQHKGLGRKRWANGESLGVSIVLSRGTGGQGHSRPAERALLGFRRMGRGPLSRVRSCTVPKRSAILHFGGAAAVLNCQL